MDDGIRVVAINPGDMENERGTMFFRRYAKKKLGDADLWREMLDRLKFKLYEIPNLEDLASGLLSAPLKGEPVMAMMFSTTVLNLFL